MSVSVPTLPPPVSADPTIDFVGLFASQDEDTILDRMRGWANEGLDPDTDADRWVDTAEPSHWFACVMPGVREFARVYDVMGTEVPMSAMLLWAWGTYLDDLAAAGNVERSPATAATGTLALNGPPGAVISQGTAFGTVPQGADDPTPTFGLTGDVTIPVGGINAPIQANEPGSVGNVAAFAITVPSTPLPVGVTFSNPTPTIGGNDPESDESLRRKVLQAIVGVAGANQAAYVKWASSWPGVGAVQVVPAWDGPNTVLVVVTDPTGQPLPATLVAALQADLDPAPGKGSGTAPVGAQVTVQTSTAHPITVDATVVWQTGHSADGSGGTIADGLNIQAAVQRYLVTVPPGGTVRVAHVAGILATWPGLENVTNVRLNGVAGDVALLTTPPESAQLTGISWH